MGEDNPSVDHICNYCRKDIPSLTYKLQQHATSHLWLKHGQCCASCIAPDDAEHLSGQLIVDKQGVQSLPKPVVKDGNHRTNILLALSSANGLEEKFVVKRLNKINRIIIAGRLAG